MKKIAAGSGDISEGWEDIGTGSGDQKKIPSGDGITNGEDEE